MLLLLLLTACGGPKDPDQDGDGAPDAEDCAPDDPARGPGAPELCNGVDDDCDGHADEGLADDTWYADADGDGWGDALTARGACDEPAGRVPEAGDCDDASAAIHPGAAETCNGVDDDCDGIIDPPESTDATGWHPDADGDGFGGGATTEPGCEAPEGTIADGSDCDDADPAINPSAAERCEPPGVDEDCDGLIDGADTGVLGGVERYLDADGDGWGSTAVVLTCAGTPGTAVISGDCDDADPDAWPGAPTECESEDRDCDGHVDDEDLDGDGWGRCVDCDEGDPAVSPGAEERCNDTDDDCDGTIDEPDATDATTWYIDADADTWGDPATAAASCDPIAGSVATAGDCDDTNARINPDGTETCATADDDDCDGDTNDPDARTCSDHHVDADADGYGGEASACLCTAADPYLVTTDGDCADTDPAVHPGAAEVPYDGTDQDCDGSDLPWVTDLEVLTLAPQPSSSYGYQLDAADVTGDGVLDLLVPDVGYDDGALLVHPGPLHVGMTDAPWALYDPDLVPGFGDVMAVGDVDGDGIEDVLAGSSAATWGRTPRTGVGWVFRGPIDADRANTDADTVILGDEDDTLGDHAAVLPDVDGDGIAEIALGNEDAQDWGAIFIVPGDRSGELDARDLGVQILGDAYSEECGSAFAGADLTGDGVGDLLSGTPHAGRDGMVYVYEGPLTGTIAASDPDSDWSGGSSTGEFALWVQAPGDLDGDGREDFIAVSSDDVVLYTAYAAGSHPFGDNTAVINDIRSSEGQPVTAADFDADGAIDLFVAVYATPPADEGVAAVFPGPLSGRHEATEATAGVAGPILATTARPVGDVDGDGLPDALVGLGDTTTQGTIYLFPGSLVP